MALTGEHDARITPPDNRTHLSPAAHELAITIIAGPPRLQARGTPKAVPRCCLPSKPNAFPKMPPPDEEEYRLNVAQRFLPAPELQMSPPSPRYAGLSPQGIPPSREGHGTSTGKRTRMPPIGRVIVTITRANRINFRKIDYHKETISVRASQQFVVTMQTASTNHIKGESNGNYHPRHHPRRQHGNCRSSRLLPGVPRLPWLILEQVIVNGFLLLPRFTGAFFAHRQQLSVCLDDEVRTCLQERAKSKGLKVNRLVNDMLKRDIDLIEAVK